MNNNKMTQLTVAVVLILCTTLAVVQHSTAGPGRPPMGPPDPMMRCIRQLNLSSETLNKVEALIQTQQESMAADRDTMKAAMDTYYAALTAAAQDSAALAQAQQAIIALEQKRAESRFALESSIVALLSADEATKLEECLSSLPEPPVGPPGFGNKFKSK